MLFCTGSGQNFENISGKAVALAENRLRFHCQITHRSFIMNKNELIDSMAAEAGMTKADPVKLWMRSSLPLPLL